MNESTIALDRPAPTRADRRRLTDRLRLRIQGATPAEPTIAEPLQPLLLRSATRDDRRAIAAVAALDNAAVPAGEAVVAIRHGRLEAVVDITTGAVIADPFIPSGDAARMARIYAHGLQVGPRLA